MISKRRFFGKTIAAVILLYPQISSADTFTAANVLGWKHEQQDNYFRTSVRMVAIVAAQMERNGHIAECIDDWHGGGAQSQAARSKQIRAVMNRLPEHHPQALILAVVQKECGKFQ